MSVGSQTYPDATRLLITADGGGSNGYRTRLWKTELADLAAETGLTITVCHLLARHQQNGTKWGTPSGFCGSRRTDKPTKTSGIAWFVRFGPAYANATPGGESRCGLWGSRVTRGRPGLPTLAASGAAEAPRSRAAAGRRVRDAQHP